MCFLSLEARASGPPNGSTPLLVYCHPLPRSCLQPPLGAPVCRQPCVTLHSLKRGKKLKIDHLRAAGSPPLQLACRGERRGKRQCERRASPPPPPPQRERLRKHFWRGFRGVTPRGRVCGSGDVRPGGDGGREGGSSAEVERIPLVDASSSQLQSCVPHVQ